VNFIKLNPSIANEVLEMLGNFDLHCIRRTAAGNPAHPGRERYTYKPELYRASTS
jgi:hypothetical protein